MCMEHGAWRTANAEHAAAALLAFVSSPLIQLPSAVGVLSLAVLLWNPTPHPPWILSSDGDFATSLGD